MKTNANLLLAVCLGLCVLSGTGTTPLHAQTILNLTQTSSVRSSSTYTYYARGNASGTTITPFTTAFYPGASLHSSSGGQDNGLVDTGSNATSISLGNGYLTDGKTNTSVSGWIDIEQVTSGSAASTHYGSFDLLFDLGSNYVITSVVLTYTDSSGKRWNSASDAQAAYTSLTFPSADSSLTSFATSTAVSSATNGSMTFDGTDITARYIDLRLNMQLGANANSGSVGGTISEVAIYGYAIPEPSAWALLGSALVFLVFFRSKKRSFAN